MKTTRKKGSYRVLETSVWNTFRRTSATPADRIVFTYLEAGPQSHYTGLFQVHLVDIAEYTGLSDKEVLQSLDRLSRWGLIVYDLSRQMVFVKGMLQRQLGTSNPNGNNVTGIVYYVERMPKGSPAVTSFLQANREIPEILDLLECMPGDTPGGDPPPPQGGHPGVDHPGGGPTRDERRETFDVRRETGDLKRETSVSQKDCDTASPVQPAPSTSESTATPGKSSEAKASGKGIKVGDQGYGAGKANTIAEADGFTMPIKTLKLADLRKRVSEVLDRHLKPGNVRNHSVAVSELWDFAKGRIDGDKVRASLKIRFTPIIVADLLALVGIADDSTTPTAAAEKVETGSNPTGDDDGHAIKDPKLRGITERIQRMARERAENGGTTQ